MRQTWFEKLSIHQSINTGLQKINFFFYFRPSLHQKLTPTEALLSLYCQALAPFSCLGDISFKKAMPAPPCAIILFPINKGASTWKKSRSFTSYCRTLVSWVMWSFVANSPSSDTKHYMFTWLIFSLETVQHFLISNLFASTELMLSMAQQGNKVVHGTSIQVDVIIPECWRKNCTLM